MKNKFLKREEYFLPDPAPPGSIPSVPKKFSAEKIVDVAEIYQRCCLEERGQWFENADQIHLVLASNKLGRTKNDRLGSLL